MGPHSQIEMRIERWLYGEGMTLEFGSWKQKDSMGIQMMALYFYWPVILFSFRVTEQVHGGCYGILAGETTFTVSFCAFVKYIFKQLSPIADLICIFIATAPDGHKHPNGSQLLRF